MLSLFTVLTLLNLLILGAVSLLGLLAAGRDAMITWHVAVGFLASLFSCGLHCFVLTYFVATGKWIQQAVLLRKLDPALADAPRRFRARTTPIGMLAIASVFIAAWAGAYVDARHGHASPRAHGLIGAAALVINALAAIPQYRAVKQNGALIDHILSKIAAQDSAAPPAPNPL